MTVNPSPATREAPLVIWEADLELERFHVISEGIVALLGHTPAGWTSTRSFWKQHIHPDDRDRAIDESRAALRARKDHTLVYRLLRADGQAVWVCDTRVIHNGPTGKPYRLRGQWASVTSHLSREHAYNQERERFRSIIALAPEGIVETDAAGTITFINDRGAAYAGYPVAELVGRVNVRDLVIPEDQQRVEKDIQAIIAGNQIGSREYVALAKDGTTRPIAVHPKVRFVDGEPAGLLVVISDLTEIKNATAAAQASGEQAQILLQEHDDAIVMVVAGKVTFCNPALERMLGLSEKDILGRSPLEFVHPADEETARERVRALMSGETLGPAEYRLRHRDGRFIPVEGRSKRILYQGAPTLLTVIRDCTAKYAAEAALNESRVRFQELLNTIDDLVWAATPDGSRYLYMNPAAETIYGRSLAEFHENPDLWVKCTHPEDAAAVREDSKTLLREGKVTSEYRILRNDGEIRWLRDKKYVVYNPDGTPQRIVGVATDITEPKWLQKELQQSEEFSRTLLDSHPDAIVLATAGRLIYHNPAVERLTGCSPEELLKRRPEENVHPDDRPHLMARLEALGRNQAVASAEYRLARADGTYLYIESVSVPFMYRGEPSILIVFRDISQRREALNALRRSEARWEAVAKSCADYIGILDRDLRVAYLNRIPPPATRDDVLGKRITDFMPADIAQVVTDHCEHVWRTGEQRRFEIEVPVTSAAAMVLDCKAAAIHFNDQTHNIALAVSDITERKRIEAAIRHHEADLELLVTERTARIRELERQRSENEKRAATGYMAARISHEINNPLASIKNSFLLLADAIPTEHPNYDLVDLIRGEIDRIANIVHQMYSIYRPEDTVVHDVDLAEVVRGVVKLLEAKARQRGVELDVGTISVPAFRGIRSHLTQVLFNLVLNGIQVSPRNAAVRVAGKLVGDIAVIAVADEGPGVPNELENRIFEPFFTTTQGGSNLGLGLTVSRSYVEAMGGTLTFRNGERGGALFQIELPISGGAGGRRGK